MALELRQSVRLSQQLLMTPQLQQAIRLLQLSRLELEQFVSQQLAENPLLEDSAEQSQSQNKDKDKESDTTECTTDDMMREQLRSVSGIVDELPGHESKEIDWEALSRLKERALSPATVSQRNHQEENPNYENTISRKEGLTEHLLSQLAELKLEEQENNIAVFLIGNLSEKGYLDLNLEEVCESFSCDQDYVEGVLDTVQRMHPPGIAARTLQECLLIQIREHQLKNGVVEKIISKHMQELETRNYPAISKSLGVDVTEVIRNAALIAGLDPIPAREFGGDPTWYIIPDVYVHYVSGRWVVMLNEDGLPHLRVSSFYRNIARDKAAGKDREYIQDKVKSAQWLIRSLQQRQKTIFKVAECLVSLQQPFFEKGVQYLKPLILRDVAESIGMHESTVSRVTTNKYIHTPRGIFELKYFFNSSVLGSGGQDLASESVKNMIREIIASEDPRRPWSDQKIVALLDERGAQLARRTVAKYREQLGILSSGRRKKYF